MTEDPYIILPLRFKRMPDQSILLVNESGEFYFINPSDFEKFISYDLDKDSSIFLDLKGKHLVTDTDIAPVIELMANKYRTRKAFLCNFTTLHMVVTTARCNHKCLYCHASSEDSDAHKWDMTPEVGKEVVNMIFKSPSPEIKIEFQGGESILNWPTVKAIVDYAEQVNRYKGKRLQFVLCTNLTAISEVELAYIKAHSIIISTSLDGPKYLHDIQRVMRSGESSYDLFIDKLELVRKFLGKEYVSPLMTMTKSSLDHVEDIIDEYVRLGFSGLFLRALNPFGFAKAHQTELGYDTQSFVEAYKKALDHIIKINLAGRYFEEFYTSLLLKRMLTPFFTGFMDLQSPAGAGICGCIYDFNGDVYPTDEARMLAKMGDKKFRLGNVNADSYSKIFGGTILRNIIRNSCVETLPGCAWCAYQSYCGADPIRNYAEQKDVMGHRPTNAFCEKHMGITNKCIINETCS